MTTTYWSADIAHSEVAFKVRHLMISNVKGVFKEFEVMVKSNHKDFSDAQISFTANQASIDTGDKKRDEHLKSSDFFEMKTGINISFVSTAFTKTDKEHNYTLEGNLTMNGIEKPIVCDVIYGGLMKDPYGSDKSGFNVKAKISRKEYGMVWNVALETGGVMVSDEVNIECDIQLVKTKEIDELLLHKEEEMIHKAEKNPVGLA